MLLIPIFLPILAGLIVGLCKPMKQKNIRNPFVAAVCILNATIMVYFFATGVDNLELFEIVRGIPILFHIDQMAMLFTGLVSFIWVVVAFFAFEYMTHEKKEERFYAFYLMTLGVLMGVGMSGNLVTLYMFYECMTFGSVPLVLHSLSKEAVSAGLKYLFYSIFGASFGLLGIFFLNQYTTTLIFTAGGSLDVTKVAGHEGLLLVFVFLMIIGFGTKAGMFPLHGWLPTAHPVAPAPGSAVLSGIITKAGVLAIIRVVFYIVGAEFIRGTWVQYTWMILALVTVFMGSMLAYKADILKKRLAYSTVSQVSYILFGLSVLNTNGFIGGVLHVLFHSFIKDALFLCAGAIIYRTHITKVSELRGIGKKMPITMWCFAFLSLALVGIPPTSGFVSKWYLAMGAFDQANKVFAYVGPIILLVSALLTAGYLITIVLKGFFPGDDFDYQKFEKTKESPLMTVPILLLTVCAVAFGMFPTPIINFITSIADKIL